MSTPSKGVTDSTVYESYRSKSPRWVTHNPIHLPCHTPGGRLRCSGINEIIITKTCRGNARQLDTGDCRAHMRHRQNSANIRLKTPARIPSVGLNTVPTLRVVILLTLAFEIRWTVNARKRRRQDRDMMREFGDPIPGDLLGLGE